ncbi:MAG TPA: hypothetical protein VFQ53_21735 [Kofleriaceae bacterium]|nr:hypothetical protein [Kofleriaceae bacterium]
MHLKGGAHAEPSFTDLGLSLNATGELSGLGNPDIVVELAARANVDATCGNPGTNTWQAPGQNPAPITVTGSQAIPASEFKNGTVAFDVYTKAPAATVEGAPDCANSMWTEVIQDLAFTSATITVQQPEGTAVLTVSCSFSSPTADGAVPGTQVTCTSD